jgi:hypothetical protein
MRLRTSVWFGIAAVCVSAGVVLAASGLPRRLGLDFWAVRGLRREIESTRHAIDRADADLAEVRVRIEAKDAILGELAAGRLTLGEAAERCREATPPAAWATQLAALRFYHPELTDEGLVYRNLIDGIRLGAAGPNPSAVVARLEAEWRAIADADAEAALRARARLLGVEPGGR